MIDLATINERLAKAKEDVAFWERALAVFLDPRIAQVSVAKPVIKLPEPTQLSPGPRPYGELKRKGFEALPDWGSHATVRTSDIVDKLTAAGYMFASITPAVSVNEALVTLESEDKAFMFEKIGNTRYWMKTQPKSTSTAVDVTNDF